MSQVIPESAVLASVIDLLIMRYRAVILRINSGATRPTDDNGESRWVRFYYWQALGMSKCQAGVSDVLALLPPPPAYILEKPTHGLLLAVECKSPDRRRNGQPAQPSPDQARFLEAVRERGGLALVCDDVQQLEDELQKRGY